MYLSDLLDVDTWALVKKAAPKVTEVPYDAAVSAILALSVYMGLGPAHSDLDGRKYWETSLKSLVEVGQLKMDPFRLGRALRSMGLMLFRRAEGYHAAWSDEQFQILKKHLKV